MERLALVSKESLFFNSTRVSDRTHEDMQIFRPRRVFARFPFRSRSFEIIAPVCKSSLAGELRILYAMILRIISRVHFVHLVDP